MHNEISFFPLLNSTLLNKIGYEASEYDLFYIYEEETRLLNSNSFEEKRSSSDFIKIIDEHGEWTPDKHELSYKKTITINNHRFLFGDNGVACDDAILGVAIGWTSKTSNQRGMEIVGYFDFSEEYVNFEYEGIFLPGTIKGKITFEVVLFLAESGNPALNQSHLANKSGMILGSLDTVNVFIDGDGSMFPIVEVQEPSQPLWWVNCDWIDPTTDSFSEENVKICLNRSHASYRTMFSNNVMNSPLLLEIVASSIAIILIKLKDGEYWQEILSKSNFEPGSIAQAAIYFIEVFDLEMDSPEKLALTLRNGLENKF